jgi:ABC-type transport system substrate-binding protein
VVRNTSALGWDTLYGIDNNLRPQRQMTESEEVSADGLTWTLYTHVLVDIADLLGRIGSLRRNHLHAPFNDVRARRAVLLAVSQEDYMRAIVGNDETLWIPLPGFFTPSTPPYTEEGGDIPKEPRDFDVAKRLLADSRYSGQRLASSHRISRT